MFDNLQELAARAAVLVNKQLTDGDIGTAAFEAEAENVVTVLSSKIPRHRTATFSGDGSAYSFALATIATDWIVGFSTLDWIEYPVGDRERSFLNSADYEYFPSFETVTHIGFIGTTPATGADNIRISYTVPWSVTNATSDIPNHLEPGFEYALACAVCRIYAAKYGHTSSNAIAADSVNYGSKGDLWSGLAKSFCAAASGALGVDVSTDDGGGDDNDSPRAAGKFVNWDPQAQPYGAPIFLRRRGR